MPLKEVGRYSAVSEMMYMCRRQEVSEKCDPPLSLSLLGIYHNWGTSRPENVS